MQGIRRALVIGSVVSGSAMLCIAPASAAQFAPAPGFASGSASCVGSVMTFAAHYGAEGEGYPQIVHGSVGPAVSADAVADGPGTVGEFNSTLAQGHGSVLACVP